MAKGPKPKKRPRENAKPATGGGGLVIVNPSLLRCVDKPAAAPPSKKQKPSNAKPGASKSAIKAPTKKGSDATKTPSKPVGSKGGSYMCDVCQISVTTGAKEMHEQGKKHLRALAQAGDVPPPTSTKPVTHEKHKPSTTSHQPAPSVRYLHVRDDDILGAVYALLELEKLHQAVVVVPNKASGALAPQTIAGALKQLGFSAIAVHSKTPATLRKQHLDKLASTSSCILVTTEHFLSSAPSPDSIARLHVPGTAAVPTCGYALLSPSGVPASSSWTAVDTISKPLLQKASSRASLATSIASLQQELPTDNDAQWIQKLASASGLDSDDVGKPTKKAAGLTPAQQKLQALSEKLFVLLATPLTGGASVNVAKMKEKLAAVGLVAQNAATGMSVHNTRLAAQTQWLDGADGAAYGGTWDGPVRHGASKDKTSLAVRATLAPAKDPWTPNPQPSDPQEWGGLYGKPCGHNEVVLQTLRPFFPQEVLNARVCSRAKPAPGNDGFDGCLEFVQWQCQRHKRSMTLWDAEHWLHVASDGQVHRLSKKVMVTKPLSLIRWLVANLRLQTIRSDGQIRPAALLETLSVSLVCGTTKTNQKLPLHVRQCILQYVATGSPDSWLKLELVEKSK
ncbi:Aste57867_24817 [Aphanomyces stellatus]|uniref:Aste57867_24817 protein n=1 Tax=Aphanomyces stellatus TaxID=120398 RepID=A0A485LRF9_9STRA|nr:hypothetical protein As57867_024739 [Aphanomyces stellatus]VFU01452.1 Aste57867_24817 [Aphanomyces stellatus]